MLAAARCGTGLIVAVALLAASCTDNSTSEPAPTTADETPTETVDTDGPGAHGAEPELTSTSTPTPSTRPRPFADLDHSSTTPVVEFCAALATRRAGAVVDLIAEDAVATDHVTGAVRRGREEIRAWIDEDPSFDIFERTDCGPSETAIASHFWSAVTYTHYSATNPGGTEGIAVVGVFDGRIQRFDTLYGLSSDETDLAEPVSPADRETLTAWCEAWQTFEVEQMLALTTDDVRVVPNIMSVDAFFRPRPGAGGVLGALDFVKRGNLDRGEGDCSDLGEISNGGWIATTSVLVNDESGTTLGGVSATRLRDGLISTWTPFNDPMRDGTLVLEPSEPRLSPETTADPAVVDVIAKLETVGWWDFAGGYLGVDLEADSVRTDVAADLIEVCAFLATGPSSFDEVLGELDRVSGATALSITDASVYSIVLDTGISSACPADAATADRLRPGIDPPPVMPDLAARPVPNPLPGDLRTDPAADLLPPDYAPPPAFWTAPFAYGSDDAQQLDLYFPARTDAPLLVYLHGGGWSTGDRSPVPSWVLRFVERGYVVASVGYRFAPEHVFPAQIHDVKRAIRWLKSFGARTGLIDGDRIVLSGHSAGGHLAALAAATPGSLEPSDVTPEEATFDSSVAGVVSVAGPTDLVTFYQQSYRPDLAELLLNCAPCSNPRLAEASPTSYLSPDLPPAYWAYGALDGLVDPITQGAVIASAWAEQIGSDSSRFDLVEGQAHNPFSSMNQREIEAFVEYAVTPR